MTNEKPIGPNGKPMKKFEIKKLNNEKAIFIDDEKFDYEVDKKSLEEMKRLGPQYFLAAKADIQKHFLEVISEFVGREIQSKDIAYASQHGWI